MNVPNTDRVGPDGIAAIPLWLLYEDEVESWAALQPAALRQWIAIQNFKAERHRVLLAPDAVNGAAMALGGLGKRAGALCLWHAAGIAERLPTGRYRLQQTFAEGEATQLSLGFAYAAYRFERYKRPKSDPPAVLDPPANADAGYVRMAAAALGIARDLINTPAADCGPAELAAAARELAGRHHAAYREWVGEELLPAGFRAIHAVGRASARRRASSSCAGRRPREPDCPNWCSSARACASIPAVSTSRRAPAWR